MINSCDDFGWLTRFRWFAHGCTSINCTKWKESHPVRTGNTQEDENGPWWIRSNVYLKVRLYNRRMVLQFTCNNRKSPHELFKSSSFYLYFIKGNWIDLLTGVFVNVFEEEESLDVTARWRSHDGQRLESQQQHEGSPLDMQFSPMGNKFKQFKI